MLGRWRGDRADASSVIELKRILHTLKGGARMAGLRAMGDLSHEMESALESFETGAAPADAQAIAALQAALDALQHMRDAASGGQAMTPAAELIARIRAIGAPQLPSAPVVPAAALAPAAPEDEPEVVPPAAAVVPPPATPARPVEPEPPVWEQVAELDEASEIRAMAPALPGREPVVATERQELARVDAELLDELLNNAGEVSIFRARVEQQMTSVEFNLAELERTVTRLREQLRKLELETEARSSTGTRTTRRVVRTSIRSSSTAIRRSSSSRALWRNR